MEINSSAHDSTKTSLSSRKSFLTFLFFSGIVFALLSIFYSFPSALLYYPITTSHAGGYSTNQLTFRYQTDGSFYHLYSLLFFLAIIMAIIAVVRINKNWKWGFGLIFFPLVQIAGSIINFNLGTCSSEFGDGGNWLANCSYGFSPPIIAGFLISLILLIISMAFLVIYRKQQRIV